MIELVEQLSSLALCASLPLIVLGLVLRRHGRRRFAALVEAHRALRSSRELRPGPAVVRGRLERDAFGERVVDEHGQVRLERASGAPLSAGCDVVVAGIARPTLDDAGGYRHGARGWVLDVSAGFIATGADALDRRSRRARRHALAGALLFACGVVLGAGGVVLHQRAQQAPFASE